MVSIMKDLSNSMDHQTQPARLVTPLSNLYMLMTKHKHNTNIEQWRMVLI